MAPECSGVEQVHRSRKVQVTKETHRCFVGFPLEFNVPNDMAWAATQSLQIPLTIS